MIIFKVLVICVALDVLLVLLGHLTLALHHLHLDARLVVLRGGDRLALHNRQPISVAAKRVSENG